MSIIVTPGQFTQRAEFYHQLNQLTSAGIDIVRSLEQLRRNPPAQSYSEPLRRTLEHLKSGCNLTEAFQRSGGWLPEFDIALLHATEQSGRLESCFKLLADYYTERAQLARRVLGDLAYPAFLLHFAVFITPFPALFASGNWRVYLLQTFGLLIPIYAVAALLIYVLQNKHGEAWRAAIESILHRVPMLGPARHDLALGRLAAALEALISAGVNIIEAWELAGTASGSPALKRAVVGWTPLMRAGKTPGELVGTVSRFPHFFAHQYSTGEVTGKLDETLRRLHRHYQEEGSRKLHMVAEWTPRLFYLMIILAIAYHVVRFFMGYFQELQNVVNF